MQSRKPEEEYWCVRRQNRRRARPSLSVVHLFLFFFCSQQHIYIGVSKDLLIYQNAPQKGKMVISTDIYFYI